ncbi:unnamed protein product, partial [marine sediment metagenome]
INLKKISCFVACAFGKDDVDEIYENAILPVLKSMEIKPYRVDQIEHNDDIDNKIIELISKCDICIADLTLEMNKYLIFKLICVENSNTLPLTIGIASGYKSSNLLLGILRILINNMF